MSDLPHPPLDPWNRPDTPTPGAMNRRRALRVGLGAAVAAALAPGRAAGLPPRQDVILKAIPSTGERIPAVGMGTWQTFMVENTEAELAPLRQVLSTFVEMGGRVLDSSPMYDPAEEVAGRLASELGLLDDLWVATKVWTEGAAEGRAQMEKSMAELQRPNIELMQVHNLMDVETHLDTLEEWKVQGRFRYIGVTNTSLQRYPRVEAILDDPRIDFLQTNYSLGEQQAAQRLLPKAMERGIGVIVARPFGGGGLFSAVRGQPLPAWASDFDCSAWSQFMLKYIISHPGVTCAIPATSNPAHMRENMGACQGRLPDAATRRRMEEVMAAL